MFYILSNVNVYRLYNVLLLIIIVIIIIAIISDNGRNRMRDLFNARLVL
jgi:hypothetical protein